MNRPEYWEDDEKWVAYDEWLSNQPSHTNPPDSFAGGLKAAIQKARGDPADDIPASIAFLNQMSAIICKRKPS